VNLNVETWVSESHNIIYVQAAEPGQVESGLAKGRAEPGAEPSRVEPSQAEPSRAETQTEPS